MARGNADLPPKMQLRQKTSESQRHPGRVTDYDWEDDPASTVTIGEKVEERAQKKVEKEKVDKARKNAQSKLAAIEDRLRREDVDRELTANHPPVAVTPKPKAQPKPANIPEQTPTAGAKLKAQAKTAQIPSEQTAAAKPGTKASHPKTSQTPTPAPKTPAPAPKPAAPVSAKPSAAKTTKTRETAVINSESRARRSTTASQTTQSKLNNAGTIFDDSGDSDAFVAPPDDDDEDKDAEFDDGGEKKRANVKTPGTTRKTDAVRDSEQATGKKKSSSIRSAINAVRSTTDGVGTPTPKPKGLKRKVSGHPDPNEDLPIVVSDNEQDADAPEAKKQKINDTATTDDKKKKQKQKGKKKSGGSLAANFEQKQGDDKAKALAHSTMPDEDSLVNVGASMVGDDEQDQNEFVDLIKKEPGDSKLSIITITPGDGPRTAKEARGGAKKWLINTHIPVEARNAFKHGLLRLFKTCLALSQDPWAALTAKQVQECVDTEFGPNVYQVGPKGAWVGCANYRLGDYRHDFPEIAAKLFLKFIREDNPEHFTGPEDVAEYANWALEKDKGGTAPIHWKTWGGGTKKSGILRNAFIIDMLVQTYYLSLPDIEDPRTAPRPIGLILLSEQAISRELSLWTTGYRLANKQAPQFSKQNYGDITELKNLDPKKYGEGSFKQQNYKRGSFFLKTMLSWTDDKWEAYLTDVMEAVQECRPAKTTAAQPEAIEEDDDIIFASDPPVPDEDVPMADGDGAPAASGPGGTDGDGGNGKGRDEEGGGSMRGEEPRTAEGQGYGDDKDDGENDGEGDEVRVDVAGDGDDVDSEMDIEGDVEADIEGGDGGDDEGGDEDDEEGDEEHGDSTDGGIPVASEDEDTSDSN